MVNPLNCEQILAKLSESIHQELDRLIPDVPCSFSTLYQGARYSLLSGGKRIRPLLTLAAAELLGSSTLQALRPACALEMVHTYSLIHDDLPCMDDDDFRRGKPTLHKISSEGHAVLVGDYLLTFAFEVLSKAPFLSLDQRMRLITVLATAAGGEGMIGGQVLDIAQNPTTSLKELHERKTGALFTASIQFGGIVADCSLETYEKLTLFGQKIGYLFQVVDDILDEEHNLTPADAEAAAASAYNVLHQLPGNKSLLEHILQKILTQLPAFTSS